MSNSLPELISNFPIGTKIKRAKTRKNDYEEEITVDGYLYYEGNWVIVHRKGAAWFIIEEGGSLKN